VQVGLSTSEFTQSAEERHTTAPVTAEKIEVDFDGDDLLQFMSEENDSMSTCASAGQAMVTFCQDGDAEPEPNSKLRKGKACLSCGAMRGNATKRCPCGGTEFSKGRRDRMKSPAPTISWHTPPVAPQAVSTTDHVMAEPQSVSTTDHAPTTNEEQLYAQLMLAGAQERSLWNGDSDSISSMTDQSISATEHAPTTHEELYAQLMLAEAQCLRLWNSVNSGNMHTVMYADALHDQSQMIR
jgi:hypothetical protein